MMTLLPRTLAVMLLAVLGTVVSQAGAALVATCIVSMVVAMNLHLACEVIAARLRERPRDPM